MRVAAAAMIMSVSATEVIAHEAAILDDPGEGPFDDPPAAQQLEPFGGGTAFDDLDDNGP